MSEPQFTIKDSGQRTEFPTGAIRDTAEDKGAYELIPPYPLKRLAIHYERGARKYKERNWEKGISLGRFMQSALRHLNDYRDGDRSEDHLSAAVFNIFGIVHTEEMIRRGVLSKELSTIPNYKRSSHIHYARWSKSEDVIIKDNYKNLRNAELAKLLGRTRQSVETRIKRLHIPNRGKK